MPVVRPSPPSRRLTVTLDAQTYARVVHLATVDHRPVACMAAVLVRRAVEKLIKDAEG